MLVAGDVVHLRPASQQGWEIAALVAAVEGSTCFLVLPLSFWTAREMACVVRLCPLHGLCVDGR